MYPCLLYTSTGATTTGSYRLTLADIPGAIYVAPGGDGGPMTNGWMHTGDIQVGSLDVWSFTANTNDGIFLSFANTLTNGVLDPYIRLYGPDGTLLSENGGYGTKAVQVAERATNSCLLYTSARDAKRGTWNTSRKEVNA